MKNPSFDARTLDPRLFDLNNPHWYLHVPRGADSSVYKQRAKAERRMSLAKRRQQRKGGRSLLMF